MSVSFSFNADAEAFVMKTFLPVAKQRTRKQRIQDRKSSVTFWVDEIKI